MDTNSNPFGVKSISPPAEVSSRLIIKRGEMSALFDAAQIIKAAHTRGEEIIEKAQAEAERIRVKSKNEAIRQVINESEGLLNDLKSVREEMAEQSVEVAQAILQKAWEILSGGATETEKLRIALEQAARYFVSTSAMRIRVSPDFAAEAQTWLDNRRNKQAGLELLSIEPDISVRPDEVRLYLDRGGVIRAEFAGTLEILKAQWS